MKIIANITVDDIMEIYTMFMLKSIKTVMTGISSFPIEKYNEILKTYKLNSTPDRNSSRRAIESLTKIQRAQLYQDLTELAK